MRPRLFSHNGGAHRSWALPQSDATLSMHWPAGPIYPFLGGSDQVLYVVHGRTPLLLTGGECVTSAFSFVVAIRGLSD
jgi:hypothetical protein